MNFALILFIALVVTGAIWLVDALFLKKNRDPETREPMLIEYAKSFFPVILIVFALRSFLVEPFKIPSGSMMPTLLIGDFILVNKYTYGIRLPVLNKKIVELGKPERGDVMVFRYPKDPGVDYIKRVIGVPGDTIEYRDKVLTVNGVPVAQKETGVYTYVGGGLDFIAATTYDETLGKTPHAIMVERDKPSFAPGQVVDFPGREHCQYGDDGRAFICKVPEGQYFMLGDNRDASNDGRYWGFVPDENIVGRAFFIWMNFDQLSRIGTSIR